MIHNVAVDFGEVCIDSGAGVSVSPLDAFPSYGTFKTGKNGVRRRAAGRQELVNAGEKRPHFATNGIKTSMTFQECGVTQPLAAASSIIAKGNRIILYDASSASYIENKATGVKIPIQLQNGIYMLEIAVAQPPFMGQAK